MAVAKSGYVLITVTDSDGKRVESYANCSNPLMAHPRRLPAYAYLRENFPLALDIESLPRDVLSARIASCPRLIDGGEITIQSAEGDPVCSLYSFYSGKYADA